MPAPAVAVPGVRVRETSCPGSPSTVKTAWGLASLTVGLETETGRSSLLVAALSTAPVVLLKMVPPPWSLMVAVPTTAVPPVGVAVRVKVSPLSCRLSSMIGVRTSMELPVSVGAPVVE